MIVFEKLGFGKKVRYYEELVEFIRDYIEEEYNDDFDSLVAAFENA